MKKLIILACLFFPSLAFAQYYSAPPPSSQFPGGFHNRTGRLMFGGSIGLGGMSDSGGDIECVNCDYGTAAGQGSLHIGGFIGRRFALMGEAQANMQTLATDGFDDLVLVQTAVMLAGQYWVTPQLWLKGGIGFANLSVTDTYDGASSRPENGGAIMGAIGYELLSARFFSIDLPGPDPERLVQGHRQQHHGREHRDRHQLVLIGSIDRDARARSPGRSPFRSRMRPCLGVPSASRTSPRARPRSSWVKKLGWSTSRTSP